MTIKKFGINQEHGYIGETKSKSKPKEFIESPSMVEYRHDRDVCLFIQKGIGSFTDEEVEIVKQKYFKNYQTTLL